MTLPAGAIDPTVTGKYPVILSDTLLGTSGQETFTSVRYNHKPAELESASARMRPVGGTPNEYNLAYNDEPKYTYNGARTINDGRLIMWFDPKRQAFILDRVDSTFHMNIKTSPNEDTETLERKFAKLDTNPPPKPAPPTKATPKAAVAKGVGTKKASTKASTKKAAAPKAPKELKKKAPAKKKETAPLVLPSMPAPALKEPEKPKAPEPKKPAPGGFMDDDDDDDIDSGLVIEIPGAEKPPPTLRDRPAFLGTTFSSFIKNREQEGELLRNDDDELSEGDFDPAAEEDEDQEAAGETMDMDEEEEEEEEEMEDVPEAGQDNSVLGDLEADLEADFEKALVAADMEKQLSQSSAQSQQVEEEESDISEAE